MFIYFLYFVLANLLETKLQTCNLQTVQTISLQICKSVLIEFAPSKWQKVNKHLKFNNNFDIHCQLEHFEYEMNQTLNEGPGFI